MEERFSKGAWNLKNYLANPVVLWGHRNDQPPIGRNIALEEDEKGLYAVTEFNKDDATAMQVFGLFQGRFLNAFSVGFIPKAFMMEPMVNSERKGVVFTEAELYEYSAVSVPANPGALVTREVAEQVMKTLGPRYIEMVATKSLGEQFLVVPKELAEKEEGPGEENDEEPSAEDITPHLEASLKGIITLANAAKGSKLPEQTRSLILTASTVFNEVLTESKEQISEEDMKLLKDATENFASVVKNIHPGAAELVTKSISKIEIALRGRKE
jgi:HK97 family phage prohead protease